MDSSGFRWNPGVSGREDGGSVQSSFEVSLGVFEVSFDVFEVPLRSL